MAMDVATTYMFLGAYVIVIFLGGIILFAFNDILLSIKRKFIPKGCDVFVINTSRQMNHYYQVPKDGTFKINNQTYIVNPKKIINLDEKISQKISKSLKERKNKIEGMIAKFNLTIQDYDKQIAELKEKNINTGLSEIHAAKETIQERINSLQQDLESGEEYFYHKKRASFFFIEGDPVPKNLFDYYSEVDCNIIDNLIVTALTKDPKSQKEFEKMIKGLKLWLYVAAGAGVIACLILINIQEKGVKCLGVI